MTIQWPGGKRLKDLDHDDPKWLERRQSCIGASEVAGMLGLGRYGSPAQVWANKVGDVERIDSVPMALGRAMESTILERAGWVITGGSDDAEGNYGSDAATYQHRTEPRMTASPDGWVYTEDGGPLSALEIKMTNSRDAEEEWGGLELWAAGAEDAFPAGSAVEGYYIQTLAQMEVLDVDDCYLCACIGHEAALKLTLGMEVTDREVRIIHIRRDRELGAMLVKQVGAFWSKYVDTDTCPPTTAADADALRKAWKITGADEIERPDLETKCAMMAALKESQKADNAALKDTKDRIKAIEAELYAEMRDAAVMKAGRYTVTAKTSQRKGHTVKPSTVRTMRLKEMVE